MTNSRLNLGLIRETQFYFLSFGGREIQVEQHKVSVNTSFYAQIFVSHSTLYQFFISFISF